MSWLTDLFSSGPQPDQTPRGPSAEELAAQQAAADAAAQKQANIAKRGQAVDASRQAAADYFTSMGLDPNQFTGDINTRVNQALAYTADDDPNVGQYLGNLGQTIYDARTQANRQNAGRQIDLAFAPDFETSRIADTADDPILAAINNEQRGNADAYVQNLVKRGVISASGQAAAERDLDTQGSRVKTILDDLGRTSLGAGRQTLSDVANRGRTAASSLALGNTFDPTKYTNEADQDYNNFLGGLDTSIRSKINGPLYDTSKLASIAGSAQGANNFKFDPAALSGANVNDQNDPTANLFDPNNPQNRRITF